MDGGDALLTLSVFVTERCNLRCGYCYVPHDGTDDLDFETGCRAVDFLLGRCGQAPDVHLSFWGGEPLLCFALIQRLVEYGNHAARQRSRIIHYSLPTNCTLLTPEILEFAKANGIYLSLSIDGGPSSQCRRRRPDGTSSFAAVEEGLRLLAEAGMKDLVGVRKTVTPDSAAALSADIAFFLHHGLKRIAFSPTMEEPWPDEKLAVFEEQQLQVAERWLESLGTEAEFSIRAWDEMLLRAGRSEARRAPCGAGASSLAVDIRGNLYPCHRFVAYDRRLRAQRLGDLWQGIAQGPLAALYRSLGPGAAANRTDPCRTCTSFERCLLFCPAVNYRLTGDPRMQFRRIHVAQVDSVEADESVGRIVEPACQTKRSARSILRVRRMRSRSSDLGIVWHVFQDRRAGWDEAPLGERHGSRATGSHVPTGGCSRRTCAGSHEADRGPSTAAH